RACGRVGVDVEAADLQVAGLWHFERVLVGVGAAAERAARGVQFRAWLRRGASAALAILGERCVARAQDEQAGYAVRCEDVARWQERVAAPAAVVATGGTRPRVVRGDFDGVARIADIDAAV